MGLIKVMVSSTIRDLVGERDAIENVLKQINLVEVIGAQPFDDRSFAGSSRFETVNMAKECDLFILVLGHRFGEELPSGKSATEIEFDAAFRDDPTKILVFKKKSVEPIEDKQQKFINRISNYYHGYWRTTFEHTYQLQELVKNSFESWLKNRASLGTGLNYMDHFIRLAKQTLPEPTAQVYYRVSEGSAELDYVFFGRSHSMQFDRSHIYSDFWGCLHQLYEQFEIWLA